MKTAPSFQFKPIGVMHTPFKEKFAIPRQPLVSSAKGVLELIEPFNVRESIRELETFSHIWVLFVFHLNVGKKWKATVRPPRLGGNKRVGVYASRSPFRPNAIGQSVMQLDRISFERGGVRLHVSGVDCLNGTPVLDIKPYLPYADKLKEAQGGFAQQSPAPCMEVAFSKQAESQCRQLSERYNVDLKDLLRSMLELDPRPAYKPGRERVGEYVFRLYDVEVRSQFENGIARVTEISNSKSVSDVI